MGMKIKKGYKGFKKDSTGLYCQPNYDKVYFKIGETYEVKGKLSLCNNGFHFCEDINSIHNFYNILENTICEVEILGDVVTDGYKSCTNKIKIIKKLTKKQVLELSNCGVENTGIANSGDWNSGDRNSGDRNSGDKNSGNKNSGYCNSGYCNSGYCNSGYWNSGDRNSGDRNSGDKNSGNKNSGYCNSGYCNSGNWNSGSSNSGYWNSGDWNSGNWNSGNCNSGDCNSGNKNSGNWNSGDWNSGCFNTNEPTIRLFNHDTEMTISAFRNSTYYYALQSEQLLLTEYIDNELVTHKYKDACRIWWGKLTKENKKIIKSMPNFDAKIFEEITGIKESE